MTNPTALNQFSGLLATRMSPRGVVQSLYVADGEVYMFSDALMFDTTGAPMGARWESGLWHAIYYWESVYRRQGWTLTNKGFALQQEYEG